jgi:DNA polymerase-1
MVKKSTDESKEKAVAEKPARLVLLDSHAILHRAYHALPDFTKSDGEPTGALYGLILMLLKIKDTLKPDYIISARDLPGSTHRHEIFEAYKAQRVQADDALIAQLQSAPKVFDAFGIPQYSLAGYEADDVLGTIVKNLSGRRDIEIIIASGDMDTLQLVNDRVRVFTMRKGLNDTVLYDPDAVRERYEFGPEHVVDYKALRGDPSDNIPGVKGIGEKTGTELIKLFGSIEHIYEALAKGPQELEKRGVKPRVIQLLLDGKSNAQFSKTLATIHCDVPIRFELPKRYWHMDEHTLTIEALLDDLEFRALKERLRPVLHSDSAEETVPVQEVQMVDPGSFEETAVALWLLRSDTTTPTLDDVLQYAHTEDFGKAREFIFTNLRETGDLMKVYGNIEKPLIPIIHRMNVDGVRVDVKYMQKLSKEYTEELGKIAGRIYGYAGHEFNISSPKQLGVVIYDELKITPAKQKKTATGARTTREEELAKMSHLHPIIDDVLAYRELQKLLGTYIDKIPELVAADGRLHAEFLAAGTTTGRMASKDPNLQNIPIRTDYGRRIRNAFSAEEGNSIVAIDYSQIELRIAAGLSGDEKLVQVFRDGRDVHTEVASQVFNVPPEQVDREMRRRAKIINFGILYGMGANALRANLGDTVTREEAGNYIEEYFKNFSGVARFVEKTKADAARQGFTETLFGRRRYFPGFQSSLPGLKAQAERMAVNAPIQGTQADIIKLAMIAADALVEKNEWRSDVRMLMQVHDELVFEVTSKKAEDIARALRSAMESVVDTARLSGVPIAAEASIGENWGELKKIAR